MTSVRMELLQLLLAEVEYLDDPILGSQPANWAAAWADALADREAFNGPPLDLHGETDRAEEVLERWRRMQGVILRRRARHAMGEIRAMGGI